MVGVGERTMAIEKGDLVEWSYFRGAHGFTYMTAIYLYSHTEEDRNYFVLPIGEKEPLTIRGGRLKLLQKTASLKDPIAPKHPI